METFTNTRNKSNNSLIVGLILILIGIAYFLRNVGLNVPHWLFSWHTAMLVIGAVIGYRKNFRGGGWFALVLIGGVFTLKDIIHISFDVYPSTAALALVGVGIYLILKPNRSGSLDCGK